MKRFFTLALIGFLASITSCTPDEQPKSIIIVLDPTERSDSGHIVWFKKVIRDVVLPNMGPKDRLVIIPLDRYSSTASEEIFYIDYSRNIYGNEMAGFEKDKLAMKAHKDSISVTIRQFDRVYDSSYQNRKYFREQSDVFGAIKQVPRYLTRNEQSVVIFLSDMLNFESKNVLNFEDSLNRPDDIDRFIAMTEPIDLPGASILVLTGRQNISGEKFEVIKHFWEQYFALCGAKVIDYSSGSLTSLEKLLQKK